MKIIFAVIFVVVVAILGYLFIFPSGRDSNKNVFYYYPKANVYFDAAMDEYLFLGADKITWQNAKKPPYEQPDSLGKKVLISNPKNPVWKDNEYHRLVYGAALYKTDDIQTKFYEDSLKYISKKSIRDKNRGDSENEKNKHKSGIRKFFDKLFK